jgi:hypothetical protein
VGTMKTLMKILHNTYHYNKREFEPQVRSVEVIKSCLENESRSCFFLINRSVDVAKTSDETVEIF